MNKEPVKTIDSWAGIVVNKWQNEGVIYNMTKAFWDHIDGAYAAVDRMRDITPETTLGEMKIPRHIGAYRYYVEAGFDIPEHVIPPEAR